MRKDIGVARSLFPEHVGTGATLPCTFIYNSRDPLAVEFWFTSGAWWRIGRDLLADGVNANVGQAVGELKVVVSRAAEDAVHLLVIHTVGRTLLRFDRAPLAAALDFSYGLVPRGDEPVDVEALVAGIERGMR